MFVIFGSEACWKHRCGIKSALFNLSWFLQRFIKEANILTSLGKYWYKRFVQSHVGEWLFGYWSRKKLAVSTLFHRVAAAALNVNERCVMAWYKTQGSSIWTISRSVYDFSWKILKLPNIKAFKDRILLVLWNIWLFNQVKYCDFDNTVVRSL